jgi:CRISPR-associated protein Cas5t
MRVLRVTAEGITTSFRYPHFMQQVHPTFPMPPPATIYGHIASALGEWFDPSGVMFAYRFTYEAVVRDTEHIFVLEPATGTLPGTHWPKALEGKVNPFAREVLFRPQLVLYLDRPEWEAAFRSPRYAVCLGRSQDLFTYTSVEVIDVVQAERAYFEHTLLPYEMLLQVKRGTAILMPRFVDCRHKREPTFERYLVLEERVFLPPDEGLAVEPAAGGLFWVDPTTPSIRGAQRGLAFLSFVDDGTSS